MDLQVDLRHLFKLQFYLIVLMNGWVNKAIGQNDPIDFENIEIKLPRNKVLEIKLFVFFVTIHNSRS